MTVLDGNDNSNSVDSVVIVVIVTVIIVTLITVAVITVTVNTVTVIKVTVITVTVITVIVIIVTGNTGGRLPSPNGVVWTVQMYETYSSKWTTVHWTAYITVI